MYKQHMPDTDVQALLQSKAPVSVLTIQASFSSHAFFSLPALGNPARMRQRCLP